MAASGYERRVDLDWIRIGAFALLILYHVALFFSPVEWHLNSRHPQAWIGSALVTTNPWRLTLLFLVSGAALRLLGRRLTGWQMMADRSRRLLPAFLFGVWVLVPPQAYVESVVKDGLQRGYLDYWARYFTVDRGLCLAGHCPPIPLNNLWFIIYIWAYAMIAAVLFRHPAMLGRLERFLGGALRGWGVLVAPIAYLALVRIMLFPDFGITNRFLSDGYNHAMSLAVFLLGYAMAMRAPFWRDVERLRWAALLAATATCIILASDAALPWDRQHGRAVGMMIVYAVNQWTAIVAILGFGHRHLRRPETPLLAYLREGVFPFYLVHQAVILLAAWQIDRLGLPVAIEALLLVAATVAGCLLAFEIARRSGPFRPLFGLRQRVRPKPSAAAFVAMGTGAAS